MSLFGPPDIESCKSKGDIDGLNKALKYRKDAAIRRSAAIALGELKDKKAVEPLILALKDEDESVRWKAAEALGKIKDARAVEPLIAALTVESSGRFSQRVATAADALGEIGDSRAIEPLIESGSVIAYDIHERAINALIKIGSPALIPLINALQSNNWHIKRLVITCLGELGNPQAILPLLSTLENEENQQLLCVTIEALAKFKDERVFMPLLSLLSDEDYLVREAAVVSLGRIGDKRAVEPLITVLETDKETRTIPDGSYDVYEVREAAAIALGEIGDPRAIQPLIRAFSLYYELRAKAVKALASIGTPAVEPLRSTLKDSDWKMREGAVDALGELRDKGAVDMLIALLDDDEIRYSSAKALGKIGDKRAIDPLHAAIQYNESKKVDGIYYDNTPYYEAIKMIG
jgi:HEAT repeat protein